MSNGDVFLSRSTVNTKETIEFEGETYPLVKLEISSTSHPFYTGKSKLVDTAGRVDKFMSRYYQPLRKRRLNHHCFQLASAHVNTNFRNHLTIFSSLYIPHSYAPQPYAWVTRPK